MGEKSAGLGCTDAAGEGGGEELMVGSLAAVEGEEADGGRVEEKYMVDGGRRERERYGKCLRIPQPFFECYAGMSFPPL